MRDTGLLLSYRGLFISLIQFYMVKCVRCEQVETILRAGFVRGKQRYYCKACEYHFILSAPPEQTAWGKRHHTTIQDVARYLGVSTSTVFRALHNQAGINADTRRAVLDAATQLDYQPNLLAQSLSSSETHILGVVIPDIERPFFASVVSGIQQVATNAGYRVMICQSNETHQLEVNNIQALVANRVDGLLICHSRETQTFDHIKLPHRKGIPIVHFDRVCEEINTSKVIQDDFVGAQAVVKHLLEQGCRRIAILAGPPNLLISRRRIEGHQAALATYGIPVQTEWIFHGDFRSETALAALEHWLTLEESPDAIFSIYDGGAVGLLVALRQKGISVPNEIAVAGFGNETVTGVVTPGLTKFDQHPRQIGEAAAQLFLDELIKSDHSDAKTLVIEGELVIRASSLRLTR